MGEPSSQVTGTATASVIMVSAKRDTVPKSGQAERRTEKGKDDSTFSPHVCLVHFLPAWLIPQQSGSLRVMQRF